MAGRSTKAPTWTPVGANGSSSAICRRRSTVTAVVGSIPGASVMTSGTPARWNCGRRVTAAGTVGPTPAIAAPAFGRPAAGGSVAAPAFGRPAPGAVAAPAFGRPAPGAVVAALAFGAPLPLSLLLSLPLRTPPDLKPVSPAPRPGR